MNLRTHNTAGAVATGTVLSTAAAVDRIVSEYAKLLGDDPRVLLCGGEAPMLAEYTATEFEPVPDLVLRGLCIVARSMLDGTDTRPATATGDTIR